MRTCLAVAALSVVLSGCAADTSTDSATTAPVAESPAAPKKNTEGCATATKGLIAYSEIREGSANQTMTPDDMAKKMGVIAEKLGAVATIAAPELASDAKVASVSAGRLRVALLGQGDSDVAVENQKMGAALDAVAAYCA